MEEGAAAPVAVPEAAVVAEQHAEGSTVVPMAVPKDAVVTEQHAEGVTVPMVVPEKAADGTAVPVVVPEKAVEDSTVPMVVPEKATDAEQHVEGSTVTMVAPEKATNTEQHVEGSTVPMEEAAAVDQHAEGSTVPMVLSEEAVVTDQHVEGGTAPMVVPEEAVVTDQHVQGMTAPVVVSETAADADHLIEDATTQDKHGDTDGIINVTPEERRGIIEVIAETGKFWHEWSFLKRLLSLQLMQVLGEYSEAQMVIREDGQQHSELFNQLNDALLRFEEGPPFTLQRLCEILLDPKGTYKKLPKLALALEKTLLVTSTITKCTDPYPTAQGPNPEGTAITENTDPVNAEPETLPEHPVAVSNGTQHAGGDGDEEMTDAEAEVVPGTHDDVEMQEEKPDHIADVNSDTTSGAAVACETAVSASEQSPDPQS